VSIRLSKALPELSAYIAAGLEQGDRSDLMISTLEALGVHAIEMTSNHVSLETIENAGARAMMSHPDRERIRIGGPKGVRRRGWVITLEVVNGEIWHVGLASFDRCSRRWLASSGGHELEASAAGSSVAGCFGAPAPSQRVAPRRVDRGRRGGMAPADSAADDGRGARAAPAKISGRRVRAAALIFLGGQVSGILNRVGTSV
jgi:hypothetical protein